MHQPPPLWEAAGHNTRMGCCRSSGGKALMWQLLRRQALRLAFVSVYLVASDPPLVASEPPLVPGPDESGAPAPRGIFIRRAVLLRAGLLRVPVRRVVLLRTVVFLRAVLVGVFFLVVERRLGVFFFVAMVHS